MGTLTCICNLRHWHVLAFSDETQDSKNCEARVQAGETVDERYDQRISEIQALVLTRRLAKYLCEYFIHLVSLS